jgi:hypothetical protein
LEKRLNERAESLSSQSAMTIGISFYGKSSQRNFEVFNSVKRRATLPRGAASMAAPLTVTASAPTRYAGRPPLKSRDNSEDDDDSGKETPDNEIADAATMRRIPNKARTSRHFRDHAKRDLPGSRPRVARGNSIIAG